MYTCPIRIAEDAIPLEAGTQIDERHARCCKEQLLNKPVDFSLVGGGLFDKRWGTTALAGDMRLVLRHRVVVLTLLAWLPLLLLSIAEGRAWGGNVAVPFLYDLQPYAQLLVALPLLILSDLIVHRRMGLVVGEFLERGIIPDAARAQFDTAVAGMGRSRDSIAADIVIVGFVYIVGVGFVWRTGVALDVATWYGMSTDGKWRPSLAGWWLMCISVPLFQFLLLRWYFRLLLWGRFLWQVSRIKLLLQPTDPDRCGGLGFLARSGETFAPVLLAQGTVIAGQLANRIFYAGATLLEFRVDLITMAVVMVVLILGPMLPFGPQLAAAKYVGLLKYGRLAHRYAREFDDKWLGDVPPADEPLIGSADLQSLADLGNSFEAVKGMSYVPFTMMAVVQVVLITLAPIAPLILTMIAPDELLERLIKLIF